MTKQLARLQRQYGAVREQWEATQVDAFEQPDGHITAADARNRTVQIDLGSADGLTRGVAFQVFDPDTLGVVDTKHKGRIIHDELSNPILAADLIFTPLWKAGPQRQFCLLGVIDIDGDGEDDGKIIRRLIEGQGGTVEAEVDAEGRSQGELTPTIRYVVVGKRPLVTSDELPKDAYDKMLARAVELGIDQLSVEKLREYLQSSSVNVVRADGPGRAAPTFRPRTRHSAY
jgi:hypothetical protein